jgi:phosphonoacetate hydrolase
MRNALSVTRREFMTVAGASSLQGLIAPQASLWTPPTEWMTSTKIVSIRNATPQRVCVIMFDGLGTDYYELSNMPTLKKWAKEGFYKRIQAVMPTVTNTNMAGVCCGVHADEHGITGNSYWDADIDQEQFMSDGNLLTSPTLFQRAGRFGVRSMIVSAKQKTVPLLKQGTVMAIGSQNPPAEIVQKYGKPPEIYSMDVNYWVWKIAIDVIKNQPKIGLLYVHTTDYPMHKFAPEAEQSRVHLKTIDNFLAEAADADPDIAFYIAPDHGLNSKATVLNLNKTLARKGIDFKIVMSAERDQYPKHHSGFGGTAFVYLNSPSDTDKAIKVLRDVKEIEEMLTREEAAKKYRLNPHRIGDLWLTAVKDVVFGHSIEEREQLASDYRSHGSAHERDIPCFIYRHDGKLPDASEIDTNVDICKFLYQR